MKEEKGSLPEEKGLQAKSVINKLNEFIFSRILGLECPNQSKEAGLVLLRFYLMILA